jgi:putative transposase
VITRGFLARLYPNRATRERLHQWAGAQRFLWNRLLDAEKAEYARTGKFIWKRELQPLAVAMKKEPGREFLADLPAHAVLKVVDDLDGALRKMVRDRKAGRDCGFPRVKKRFVNEAGIYCVNQNTEIAERSVKLPKLGTVKMRGGRAPDGRLLGTRVWRNGARWMLSAQFECARPTPLPPSDVTVGLDRGVGTLANIFDGNTFEDVAAPKHLRKSLKRLRRAQRVLSRRRKGSARRRIQARRVGVIHRKVRERRRDILHQLSHRLTAKAGVVKVETLNVKGMARNRHLALSVADAGMSRLASFLAYKADWRGRRIVECDPWFASSQTCCMCGALHPEMKKLSVRMLRCDCGNVMDRVPPGKPPGPEASNAASATRLAGAITASQVPKTPPFILRSIVRVTLTKKPPRSHHRPTGATHRRQANNYLFGRSIGYPQVAQPPPGAATEVLAEPERPGMRGAPWPSERCGRAAAARPRRRRRLRPPEGRQGPPGRPTAPRRCPGP